MALTTVDFIEAAIKKQEELGDIPLSHRDMASIAGFSEEELVWVDRFWGPTFNDDWIYLSEEVVIE